MRGLIAGASYPFRAAALIARTPALWPFLIVPVLVNVAVGVLIYAGLLVAGLRGIDRLMAGLPPELGLFEPLLQAVLIVVLLLVTGFVFVRFGVILGAPWYEALSARVEKERTGALPDTGRGGLLGALGDVIRQVGHEGQKLGFVFGLGSLLLLLSLIPAAGTVLATAGGSRWARRWPASTSSIPRSPGGGCASGRSCGWWAAGCRRAPASDWWR